MIRRGPRSNSYCGPAALAAITGRHVDDVTATLRIVMGARPVRGTSKGAMVKALELMGYRSDLEYISRMAAIQKKFPTLAGWLRATGPKGDYARSDAPYLVLVTGHWIVIKGRKLYDNRHLEGVFAGKYEHRRKRVQFAWVCRKETNRHAN